MCAVHVYSVYRVLLNMEIDMASDVEMMFMLLFLKLEDISGKEESEKESKSKSE